MAEVNDAKYQQHQHRQNDGEFYGDPAAFGPPSLLRVSKYLESHGSPREIAQIFSSDPGGSPAGGTGQSNGRYCEEESTASG